MSKDKTTEEINEGINKSWHGNYNFEFQKMVQEIMYHYAEKLQKAFEEMDKARNLWEKIHEAERKQISMQNIHKMLRDAKKEEGNLTKGLSNKEIELEKVKNERDELKIPEQEIDKEEKKLESEIKKYDEIIKIQEEKIKKLDEKGKKLSEKLGKNGDSTKELEEKNDSPRRFIK